MAFLMKILLLWCTMTSLTTRIIPCLVKYSTLPMEPTYELFSYRVFQNSWKILDGVSDLNVHRIFKQNVLFCQKCLAIWVFVYQCDFPNAKCHLTKFFTSFETPCSITRLLLWLLFNWFYSSVSTQCTQWNLHLKIWIKSIPLSFM